MCWMLKLMFQNGKGTSRTVLPKFLGSLTQTAQFFWSSRPSRKGNALSSHYSQYLLDRCKRLETDGALYRKAGYFFVYHRVATFFFFFFFFF